MAEQELVYFNIYEEESPDPTEPVVAVEVVGRGWIVFPESAVIGPENSRIRDTLKWAAVSEQLVPAKPAYLGKLRLVTNRGYLMSKKEG